MADPTEPVSGLIEKIERVTCEGCIHSDGATCVRGATPYEKSYETTYTDSDFCGPDRRYFKRRLWFSALRARETTPSIKGDAS